MNTNRVDWAAEVATAISAMKEETQKAYTYLKQEAPEVGREYVQWKMAESGFAATACIVCAAVFAYMSKKLCKRNDGHEAACIFTIPAAVILVFIAFQQAAAFTKCLVAPRIVIIEGIKEVVR